jgi:hypothetical protein
LFRWRGRPAAWLGSQIEEKAVHDETAPRRKGVGPLGRAVFQAHSEPPGPVAASLQTVRTGARTRNKQPRPSSNATRKRRAVPGAPARARLHEPPLLQLVQKLQPLCSRARGRGQPSVVNPWGLKRGGAEVLFGGQRLASRGVPPVGEGISGSAARAGAEARWEGTGLSGD